MTKRKTRNKIRNESTMKETPKNSKEKLFSK
jgi:hypothetical protein